MSLLKLENVSKSYFKDTYALKNISLVINEKDFCFILGPSGCGKTTLLNLISLIDYPTAGNIYFDNTLINKFTIEEGTKYRRENIGIVFQDYNLLPMLNVEQNILLPILLENKEQDQKYFETIISILDIKKILRNNPNTLSGGEKQRVAIARALINKPRIVLADEPTGNLDTKNGLEVMHLFKELNRILGTTIIIVTHNESYISSASKVIRMKDGEILSNE